MSDKGSDPLFAVPPATDVLELGILSVSGHASLVSHAALHVS